MKTWVNRILHWGMGGGRGAEPLLPEKQMYNLKKKCPSFSKNMPEK